MRDWRIMHKNHDGTNRGQLQPENLSFSMIKGEAGSSSVAYELDLGHSESVDMQQFTEPYRTDFELSVDNIIIMAGMHTDITFNTDDNFIQIAGRDWLHYLERREYPFDPVNPNLYRIGTPDRGLAFAASLADIKIILETILNTTLAQPYSLPITYTVPTMGVAIDYEFSLGDTGSIHSKIAELAQEEGGVYDFWVTPAKVLEFGVPRQYTTAVMTDPNACAFILDNSNTIRANVVGSGPGATRFVGYGSGNEVRLGLQLMDNDLANVYRRLDGNADFGDIPNRERVNKLTRAEFFYQKFSQDKVTVDIEATQIDSFWNIVRPGKAIWIDDIPIGPLTLGGPFELLELSGSVSTEGGETISLTLDPIHFVDEPSPPAFWTDRE